MLSIYLEMLENPEHKSKFELLFDEYKLIMYHVALGILGDNRLAEDAVNEAFIRLAKNFAKIKEISCPQTRNFVVIVVRNISLTMLKGQPTDAFLEEWQDVLDSSAPVDERVFDSIGVGRIVAEILKLPPIYKDAIYFSCVEELSIGQIGKLMHLPHETVKKRIQRGKAMLIKRLQEEGIVDSE